MKKLFFTLCALCLCGTMWADTIGDDIQKDATTGLYFATVTYDNATTNNVIAIIPAQEGETYSLNNLVQNTDGTYTLPATVQAEGGEEVALQGVAASAFAEALTDTGNPIHLVIPANIIDMGQKAFQNCTQIGEVTVEYSETALDEAHNVTYGNSFSGCSNLKVVTQNRNIDIHRNNSGQVAYICFPFADLPSIETVYIGEKVTALGNNAYNARTTCNLKDVYCYTTNSIPTLDHNCFLYQAEGCTLYVYDELVETFKADKQTDENGWGDIFSNIEGMGSVNAGLVEGTFKDVNTGLYCEFNEDSETVSIYLDEEVGGSYTDENLVVYSYDEEGNPNAYTLPETVQAEEGGTEYAVNRVEAEAFKGANIVGHLVIPTYITAIGEGAFRGCIGITEVTYEYTGTALQDEYATNNGGNYSFAECTGIQTVNMYRNISLGNSSYYICGPFCWHTSIQTINIGPHITEIPHYMFHNSGSSLTTINCYALEVPNTVWDPFGTVASGCVVNVPAGLVDTYAAASYSPSSNSGATWGSYFGEGNIKDMSNAFAITTHENEEGTAYATFYNSVANVELFDGELTAYEATTLETENGELIIDIAELGNVVPSSTGVIVETATESTYLAIATENSATSASNNHLYGYDTAQTINNPSGSYYYYLLSSNEDGVVGFYWGAEDGGVFQCQAHKAYLALPQGTLTGTSGIKLKKGEGGDETTGISSVEVENEANAVKGIYTLQGVRVSNMNQKGVYIVDGKKVLVK